MLRLSNVCVVSTVMLALAVDARSQCQMTQVVDPSPNFFEYFGRSVSTAGTVAIVGAPNHSTPSTEAGAAFVWSVSGGVWTFDQKIQPNTIQTGDLFGTSVATDGTRLVIGAPWDDTIASNAGAAYVYRADPTFGWVREAKLVPTGGSAGDQFGKSVSISGTRLAVGAPGGQTSTGSVRTYTRSGTTWTAESTLTPSATFTPRQCGYSVSLDGSTLLAGAVSSSVVFGNPDGAAFVWTHSGSWSQQAALTSPTPTAHGKFGISVSLSGTKLVIGAPWEHSTSTSNGGGFAHVFALSGSTWSLEQSVAPNDVTANEYVGWSVALNGNNLLAGSYLGDAGGDDSGAAYFYAFNGTSWKQRSRVVGLETVAFDSVGSAVSISTDYAIAGSEKVDTAKGAAYIFSLCP